MLRSIILLVIALLLPTAADAFAPSLTAYDGNSNLLARIDANSQIIDGDFDELSRMTQRRWSGGATSNAQPTDILREVSTHDANGQLISQSQFEQGGTSHTVSNVFDRQRRLSTETDRFGVSTTHEYDAQDNRIARIDPSGRSVFGFDPLNRLRSVQPAVGASTESPVALAYTDAGRLKQQFAPNGAHSEHVYDPAGRIKTLIHTQTGVEVARFEYAYDGNGNRSGQSQTTPAGIRTTTYRYDRDDRLIGTDERTEGGRLIATLTTLDAVGNRKTEAVTDNGVATQTQSYAYSPRHALQSRSDSVDGNTVSYSHDANGSLISETTSGSTPSTTGYRRNPQDRLATLTAPTGPPVEYHYDSRGLRVEKRSALAATRFGYDGRRLRRETNVANNLLATYEWAAGRLVHSQQQSNTRYPQHDALATPIRWSSSDGAEQGKRTIDAWGTTTSSTGSLPPIGFTGHYLDAESGDYYAQQRYYRPGLGRFSRIDPWEGDTLSPITLNKYLYANGNPLIYIDADGRVGILADLRDRFDETDVILRAQAAQSDSLGLLGYSALRGLGQAGSLLPRLANLASDGVASILPGEAFSGVSEEGGRAVGETADVLGYVANNKVETAQAIHGGVVATTVGVLEGDRGAASDAISGLTQLASGSAVARRLTAGTAIREGRAAATVVEGANAQPAARVLDSPLADQESAALRRIAANNADGAAATSATGFRVTVEGASSGGRGLGANGRVDRIAHEYASAVQQANRILQTNRAPATAWERIYRGYLARGQQPPEYVRGNALQQVADRLMESNRYAQESGIIVNRQSNVDALRPLRPDVQVPITEVTQGVIDITTPKQAAKIDKYNDPANEALINILYEQQ